MHCHHRSAADRCPHGVYGSTALLPVLPAGRCHRGGAQQAGGGQLICDALIARSGCHCWNACHSCWWWPAGCRGPLPVAFLVLLAVARSGGTAWCAGDQCSYAWVGPHPAPYPQQTASSAGASIGAGLLRCPVASRGHLASSFETLYFTHVLPLYGVIRVPALLWKPQLWKKVGYQVCISRL